VGSVQAPALALLSTVRPTTAAAGAATAQVVVCSGVVRAGARRNGRLRQWGRPSDRADGSAGGGRRGTRDTLSTVVFGGVGAWLLAEGIVAVG
jgi:hypothetical protein